MDPRPASVPAPGRAPAAPAAVAVAAPTSTALGPGLLLALAGAAGAILSLWLTWFDVRIADALNSVIGSRLGTVPPAAAGLVQGLQSLAPQHITADGWTAFQGADDAIAALAAGIGAVVLASAGALGPGLRATRKAAASVAAWGGAALLALVGWKLLHLDFPSRYIHIGPGAWLALGSAACVSAGGWLAGGGR